ncbi:MAG: ABC transporter substrate-binding protein [Burkholderiaceae bacterium]|nr:ABC transporter substrate-binding protein [Burkholderiaceae bacterium]
MSLFTRRQFITTFGAAAASICLPATAHAQRRPTSLTVRDPGGSYVEAFKEAFYLPFEKKTGIKIVSAVAGHDPTAQIKAMVEARSHTWDVALVARSAAQMLGGDKLLEPLNVQGSAFDDLPDTYRTEHFAGVDIYAAVLAYRTDTLKRSPSSWADLWDIENFPGRRSLRNHPFDTIEVALMADGVPTDQVYPCDMDRAFKSLEKLAPNVNIWWGQGAQSTQLIQSGEVDMIAMWNGAAQRVVDAGAPVAIQWNQNIANVEGWVILGGTPKAEVAREFVAFTMDPKQQAILAKHMAYGPANPKAFDYIEEKRAVQLSTHPEYRRVALNINNDYWAENKDIAMERFNTWKLR